MTQLERRTLIGIDPAQMEDYTAVAIVERVREEAPRHPHDGGGGAVFVTGRAKPPPARYRVVHTQRFPLRTSYEVIVERLVALLGGRRLPQQPVTVLLDTTGVGRGILDMFHKAKVRPVAISIHGGHEVTSPGGLEWHVPKKDLVWYIQILSQHQPAPRLELGEDVPFAKELRAEMRTFRATMNPLTAHESFAAWREQDHDDLILAIAMCTWHGEVWADKRIVVY